MWSTDVIDAERRSGEFNALAVDPRCGVHVATRRRLDVSFAADNFADQRPLRCVEVP